jgi:hypothetical protein
MDIGKLIVWKYGPGLDFFIKRNKLIWNEKSIPKPSDSELQQIKNEYNEYIESTQYIKNREREYPTVQYQLDYIYDYGIEAWKNNVIKPIKDKYPKP